MCDYIIYYLLAGAAYAIIQEIQYRREESNIEYDEDEEYWFWGDMLQMLLLGLYHTVFWPKCIIDEMIDSYLDNQLPNDEDKF